MEIHMNMCTCTHTHTHIHANITCRTKELFFLVELDWP